MTGGRARSGVAVRSRRHTAGCLRGIECWPVQHGAESDCRDSGAFKGKAGASWCENNMVAVVNDEVEKMRREFEK
jgi:hypothetical protein